jgi:hypothetical protein
MESKPRRENMQEGTMEQVLTVLAQTADRVYALGQRQRWTTVSSRPNSPAGEAGPRRHSRPLRKS